MKTPISYYGGKQAIIHHILPLIPKHEYYTEVFFGGGAVFFAKQQAKNEIINDRLDVVINFYRVLKSNFSELQKLIDETIYSRTLYKKAQASLRKKSKATDVEKAWAFFFHINTSYASKFQSALTWSNKIHTVDADTFQNKKERFTSDLQKRVEHCFIENSDALYVLRNRNVEDAFHYQDPPYPNADQGHYKGYTWQNYEELLRFNECDCKGKFLLSSYNSEMLQKFIDRNGWHKKEITQRIRAPKNRNFDKVEVLVWNYNIHAEKRDLFYN